MTGKKTLDSGKGDNANAKRSKSKIVKRSEIGPEALQDLRERNKTAAKKARLKKKNEEERLKEKKEELIVKNEKARKENEELEEKVKRLKASLLTKSS